MTAFQIAVLGILAVGFIAGIRLNLRRLIKARRARLRRRHSDELRKKIISAFPENCIRFHGEDASFAVDPEAQLLLYCDPDEHRYELSALESCAYFSNGKALNELASMAAFYRKGNAYAHSYKYKPYYNRLKASVGTPVYGLKLKTEAGSFTLPFCVLREDWLFSDPEKEAELSAAAEQLNALLTTRYAKRSEANHDILTQ